MVITSLLEMIYKLFQKIMLQVLILKARKAKKKTNFFVNQILRDGENEFPSSFVSVDNSLG